MGHKEPSLLAASNCGWTECRRQLAASERAGRQMGSTHTDKQLFRNNTTAEDISKYCDQLLSFINFTQLTKAARGSAAGGGSVGALRPGRAQQGCRTRRSRDDNDHVFLIGWFVSRVTKNGFCQTVVGGWSSAQNPLCGSRSR